MLRSLVWRYSSSGASTHVMYIFCVKLCAIVRYRVLCVSSLGAEVLYAAMYLFFRCSRLPEEHLSINKNKNSNNGMKKSWPRVAKKAVRQLARSHGWYSFRSTASHFM